MACFVYCFILSRYLFSYPSFTCSFWFISSSCIVCFTCVDFSFPSRHVPTFSLCFIIFACCRFRICIFIRISQPGFNFYTFLCCVFLALISLTLLLLCSCPCFDTSTQSSVLVCLLSPSFLDIYYVISRMENIVHSHQLIF